MTRVYGVCVRERLTERERERYVKELANDMKNGVYGGCKDYVAKSGRRTTAVLFNRSPRTSPVLSQPAMDRISNTCFARTDWTELAYRCCVRELFKSNSPDRFSSLILIFSVRYLRFYGDALDLLGHNLQLIQINPTSVHFSAFFMSRNFSIQNTTL